jgi:hypothetical protein
MVPRKGDFYVYMLLLRLVCWLIARLVGWLVDEWMGWMIPRGGWMDRMVGKYDGLSGLRLLWAGWWTESHFMVVFR